MCFKHGKGCNKTTHFFVSTNANVVKLPLIKFSMYYNQNIYILPTIKSNVKTNGEHLLLVL
jgi:hypothetical protein